MDRVTAEEDGPIQADDIVVSLLGIELDGEATRIPSQVWELSAKSNGTESYENGRLLSNTIEEIRLTNVSSGREIERLITDFGMF